MDKVVRLKINPSSLEINAKKESLEETVKFALSEHFRRTNYSL